MCMCAIVGQPESSKELNMTETTTNILGEEVSTMDLLE